MIIFALSLIAVASLAADSRSSLKPGSIGETVDSLKTMVMKQHPEVLPKFFCTFGFCKKEHAQAFSIGIHLGKSTEMLNTHFIHGNLITVRVCSNKLWYYLLKLFPLSWKDENETPFKFESAFNQVFKTELLFDDLQKSETSVDSSKASK